MKISPLSILLDDDFVPNKNFYYISGNESTLIEKISAKILEFYQKDNSVSKTNINSIDDFVKDTGLFEDKKIFISKNCSGINKVNLDKIRLLGEVFIFVQENSSKTKRVKDIFLKDKDSYLIDCYELDKDSKIKILNKFLNTNQIKIKQDIYWLLVDKLSSKYIFLENSLNKILELTPEDLTLGNIKKVLTIDDSGKDKLFFSLSSKNRYIVNNYRDKIMSPSDVNELYYYCRFFCQLIIECKDENDYNEKIPIYLFREKKFLTDVYKKFNFEKKKLLLNLLYTTEKFLRKEGGLSLVFGLRFLLNIKRIIIS